MSWDVKTRLSEMKDRGEDYLSEQTYRILCESHGIVDEEAQQKLLRRLADIGTVVSFPDDVKLSELSVLNPKWATDGIYKVLTNDELKEKRHGLLSREKLRALLPKKHWPDAQHVGYVLALMMKFDLCFAVDGDDNMFLVPELLQDKTPPMGNWKSGECVTFQYTYPVLPHGILPRFITRSHKLSEGRERWRTGVLLFDDDAEARLQADYDKNVITILVRGKYADARRALLKVIRSHFECIHSRIEGLDPREMVAVPGHSEVLVNYRDVLMDERRAKLDFAVTINGERIDLPIQQLLNGIESKEERDRAWSSFEDSYLPSKVEVHGDLYEIHNVVKTKMKNDHSINIGGNVTNSQIAQRLSKCTNMIHQMEAGRFRELIEQLDWESKNLIAVLPEDKQVKASQNLELAIKSIIEVDPDRSWYEVSSKGLLEASKYVKDFSGNIAGAITNLGKSVWPDFLLSEDS